MSQDRLTSLLVQNIILYRQPPIIRPKLLTLCPLPHIPMPAHLLWMRLRSLCLLAYQNLVMMMGLASKTLLYSIVGQVHLHQCQHHPALALPHRLQMLGLRYRHDECMPDLHAVPGLCVEQLEVPLYRQRFIFTHLGTWYSTPQSSIVSSLDRAQWQIPFICAYCAPYV